MVTLRHANRNNAQPFPAARASCCISGQSGGNLALQSLAPNAAPNGGGVDVRIHPSLSVLAATLIALLPVHAAAQEVSGREEIVSVRERDRPELDPLGARLGAFTLNASIDFDVTSTDNLFASPSGAEQDDVYYTVAPRARLASGWSRHSFAAEAGAAWRSHDDFSNEDVETYYLRGVGRIDVGADTAVHGSARVAHEFVPRTDPDSPSVGSPTEYDDYQTSVGLSHRFARFSVRGDLTNTERDYDGAASNRDYDQTGLRGRAEIELSPRVGLLLQASADERSYDNAPGFDSEGRSLLVGVALDTDLMRGEVSVGQFEREYDSALIGSVDGLAVAGSLEWYVTPLTTITFDALRNAEDELSLAQGLPYVTTEFGARVDHELLRNFIVTAAVRSGDRDYEGASREDEYMRYEVGGDYLINRRVALRGRFTRNEVDSTVPARNFEADAFTVGLSLRL